MPMDDDRGRGRTSGVSDKGGGRDRQDAPSKGQTVSTGGGGGNSDNRGGGAAKEAADQKAREDAAAKSGEERRAKEAKEQGLLSLFGNGGNILPVGKFIVPTPQQQKAESDAARQQELKLERDQEAQRVRQLAMEQEQEREQERQQELKLERDQEAQRVRQLAMEQENLTKAYQQMAMSNIKTPDIRNYMTPETQVQKTLTEQAVDALRSGYKSVSNFMGSFDETSRYNPNTALGSIKGNGYLRPETSIKSSYQVSPDLEGSPYTPQTAPVSSESESKYFYDPRGFNSQSSFVPSNGPLPPVRQEEDGPNKLAKVLGGSEDYKPKAPEAEKPFYDKLIGDFNSLFDSTSQITALEAQGKLAGGLTKQEYAVLFAGGDLSKVKSRIVDYGQGPQVDYYSKSLGDKFGEAVSDLGKGFSDAGKGITSLFGGETSTAMQPIVADPFVPTGFGPGGDLTREQYNEQYGGRDIAVNLPPTGASATPPPVVSPVVPPVVPPVAPSFTPQRYTGTPTVATQGFDFSRPFAPRPPMDFANLGQAYAPTDPSTAPAPPVSGVPGAAYATPYQRLG